MGCLYLRPSVGNARSPSKDVYCGAKFTPYYSDADCLSPSSLELLSLPDQISDHAVDLLDHRLSQYLGLNSNLDRCDRTAGDRETLVRNRLRHRNALAERPIAPPTRNPYGEVLRV